jgi:hypothetical protein
VLMMQKSTTAAHRRYAVRTFAFMGGYVVLMVAVMFGALDPIQNTPAAWLLAVAATAPIIGQIWATLRLMAESDEFVRAVTAKQFILAAGAAMALSVLWGFGESFAGAPHIPAWLIYPLFWLCFGLIAPFVRSSQ